MNPKQRAFLCLERLLKFSSLRLSLAKREFRIAKVMCAQQDISYWIAEIKDSLAECDSRSSAIKKLAIEKRVA